MLRYAGLRDNMSPIDFGCGSGRLTWALGREPIRIDYDGIDVEQRLLDSAKTNSLPHFRFALNRTLCTPAPYISADAAPWGDTAPLGQSAVILRRQ